MDLIMAELIMLLFAIPAAVYVGSAILAVSWVVFIILRAILRGNFW